MNAPESKRNRAKVQCVDSNINNYAEKTTNKANI